MLTTGLHKENYALERMEKRFKVYEFIAVHHLYPAFVAWYKDHPSKSRYNAMYRFIVHLKRVDELKHPSFDRQHEINVFLREHNVKPICDYTDGEIHAKWVDKE